MTSSVFDILIITSVKTLILFILISELESNTIYVATQTESVQTGLVDTSSTTALINDSLTPTFQTPKSLKLRFYHFTIRFLASICTIYTVIKFSLILDLIIKFQHQKTTHLPMDYYYFIILSIELFFCLIQLLMSAFSSRQMKKLAEEVRRQAADTTTKSK